MKRVFGLLIAIIMCTSVFSGCSGNNVQKDGTEAKTTAIATTAKPTTEEPKKEVTLSFMSWRAEDTEAYNQMIAKFNETYPNVKIEMEYTPNTNDYYTKLKARVLAKESLDLISLHPGVGRMGEYVDAGAVMELSEDVLFSDVIPSTFEAGMTNGKLYGVAQALNTSVVFYNKKIFDDNKLNVPKNWNEFINVCDVLKNNNIVPLMLPVGDYYTLGWFWETIMDNIYMEANNGSNVGLWKKIESKEITASDLMFTVIGKRLQTLRDKGYIDKDFMGTKYEPGNVVFAQGKVAMLPSGTWAIPSIRKASADFQFGVFPIPAFEDKEGRSVISPAQAISICSNTKNPEECKAFIKFAYSKEGAAIYSNVTGQISTTIGIEYTNNDLNLIKPIIEGNNTYLPISSTNERSSGKFLHSFTNGFIKMLSGSTLEEGLVEAQKQVDSLIQTK